jgi:hypothetical protein
MGNLQTLKKPTAKGNNIQVLPLRKVVIRGASLDPVPIIVAHFDMFLFTHLFMCKQEAMLDMHLSFSWKRIKNFRFPYFLQYSKKCRKFGTNALTSTDFGVCNHVMCVGVRVFSR